MTKVTDDTLSRLAADVGMVPKKRMTKEAVPEEKKPEFKPELDLSGGHPVTATWTELFGSPSHSGNDWILPDFRTHAWNAEVAHFVPAVDAEYVPRADLLEAFVVSLYGVDNRSALLHGDRGTGKSSLPEYVCGCMGIPFIRVNMTADTEGNKLLGNVVIKDGGMGWQTGALELAALAGDVGCWLQVDEFSAAPAGINMNMQWVLERGGKVHIADKVCDDESERTIVPKNFFKIIATDNTQLQGDTDGGYVGTEPQNVATLDRFDVAMKVDFPDRATETKIIISRTGIDASTAKDIMDIAEATRRAASQTKMNFSMSPRATQQVARQYKLFGNLRQAFDTGYCGKLIPTDAAAVAEMLAAKGV